MSAVNKDFILKKKKFKREKSCEQWELCMKLNIKEARI